MKHASPPVFILLLVAFCTNGQLIIKDEYNVPSGTTRGFNLGEGLNAGINPPAITRLTGSAAADLRYFNCTPDQKTNTAYYVGSSEKLRVNSGAQSGRISLSLNGTSAYNFRTALGLLTATPAAPIVYEVTISMDNNSPSTQRMSFAIATEDNSAGFWDFGFQLYRAQAGETFFTVGKRIDALSSGLSDLNKPVATMGTPGDEIWFLMRVTDAGTESSAFSSRIQLSANAGATWFYDTLQDPDLSGPGTGFRFDANPRFFLWDIAPNDSFINYDDFSVTKLGVAPAAPAKTVTRAPGTSLKIPIADLNLASGVNVVSVGASANATITRDDSRIYYTPNPNFNNSDTFIYTVTNGTLENAGRITVNVERPGGQVQIIDYTPGGVSLRFAAIPDIVYDIERSDAANGTFAPIHTFTCPGNGIYTWTDPSPLSGAGFYRLRQH